MNEHSEQFKPLLLQESPSLLKYDVISKLTQSIIGKCVLAFGKDSFIKTLERMFFCVINPIVTTRYVYKLDLDNITFIPQNKNFTLEEMTLTDLKMIYSTNEDEIPTNRYEYLQEAINNARTGCYLLRNPKDDVCGYCTLEFGKGRHGRILSKVKGLKLNETGYTSRDYTFKMYRGKGIHKLAIYKRLIILKSKGYRTALTRVAASNIISNHN